MKIPVQKIRPWVCLLHRIWPQKRLVQETKTYLFIKNYCKKRGKTPEYFTRQKIFYQKYKRFCTLQNAHIFRDSAKRAVFFVFSPTSKLWAIEFYEAIFHRRYTIVVSLLKSCKNRSILRGRKITCALCRFWLFLNNVWKFSDPS